MNIRLPHGMIERIGERQPRPTALNRYGRKKEGSPKDDPRTSKIANEQDRRRHPRHDDDPLRGRLLDLNA